MTGTIVNGPLTPRAPPGSVAIPSKPGDAMKIVCVWCKPHRVLRITDDGHPDLMSGSICPSCKETVMNELRAHAQNPPPQTPFILNRMTMGDAVAATALAD